MPTSATGSGAVNVLGPELLRLQTTEAATVVATIRNPGYIDFEARTWETTGGTSTSQVFARLGCTVSGITAATGAPTGFNLRFQNTAGSALWSVSAGGATDQEGGITTRAGAHSFTGTTWDMQLTGAYVHAMTDANTGAAGSQTTQSTIVHASSGTPVAGFGTLQVLRGHNAANTMVDQGYFSTSWTNAGAGTEAALIAIGYRTGGAFVQGMVLQEPADGQTALQIRRNVGGVFSTQIVSMGAADSAGAGFKLLKVPN